MSVFSPNAGKYGPEKPRIWTLLTQKTFLIRKNIFACLFSVHNTISLSRHEQVCLMRLRFERYFSNHLRFSLRCHHNKILPKDLQLKSRPDDGRSISRNVASLNILVHDVINLLYYEH